MPLSKTQQNTRKAFILASKLNSFQKQQLRNGKCFFEKSSKVMVWGLNYNKKHFQKIPFIKRCIFRALSEEEGPGSWCQNALFYHPGWQLYGTGFSSLLLKLWFHLTPQPNMTIDNFHFSFVYVGTSPIDKTLQAMIQTNLNQTFIVFNPWGLFQKKHKVNLSFCKYQIYFFLSWCLNVTT